MKKVLGKISGFFRKIGDFFYNISEKISKKVGKLSNRTREILAGLLFVSPWIIGFAIFGIYPIVRSIHLSLCYVETVLGDPEKGIPGGITTTFIGFDNYKIALLEHADFMTSILNFLKESLLMVFIINVFAVLFAVILNSNIKGKGIFRTIFFLPVIVVSGPVMAMLQTKGVITVPNIGNFGIVNIIGATFGETIKNFIANTFGNLIYMFWFSGVQLIVYLTMLQKMDKSQYEAANIDGASVWESFWKITLPALKPAILINLVYTIILLATFDKGSDLDKTVGFIIADEITGEYGMGLASAMAWIYFVILAVIIIVVVLALYGRFGDKDKRYVAGEAYIYNQTRYMAKSGFFYTNRKVKKVKNFVLGKNFSDGLIAKVFVYLILGVMSFAFLYPFLHMLLTSLQSPEDTLNPMVNLLPTELYVGNMKRALNVLSLFPYRNKLGELQMGSLFTSIIYSLVPTILQVVSCALVGYGLAKFKFPGKKIVFALVIASFIIPPQVLMIPTLVLYKKMDLLGSIWTFALPAAFAQGLKNTVFIMLYFQFFNMLPKELDEAAEIDGAGKFKIFMRVAIPLTVPMFIVAFIFSFVWYWNETYLTSQYMPGIQTVPLQLKSFEDTFKQMFQQGNSSGSLENTANDAIFMAGTLISLIPLLIMYFLLQKQFVEGIDKAGLTGQ